MIERCVWHWMCSCGWWDHILEVKSLTTHSPHHMQSIISIRWRCTTTLPANPVRSSIQAFWLIRRWLRYNVLLIATCSCVLCGRWNWSLTCLNRTEIHMPYSKNIKWLFTTKVHPIVPTLTSTIFLSILLCVALLYAGFVFLYYVWFVWQYRIVQCSAYYARGVTKFAFEFNNVRTSNVFSRFRIRQIFSCTRRRIRTSRLHDWHHMSTPTGHR